MPQNKENRSNESIYHSFFEDSPSAFMIIDKNGFITDVNGSFIRSIAEHGNTRDYYTGRNIFSQHSSVHPVVLDMCKAIRDGEKKLKTVISVTSVNSEQNSYYTVSGAPLSSDGVFKGIALVYEDITEQIKTEKDLSRSRNELINKNEELNRLTENLEKAIDKANRMAVEAEIATISKSIFLASMSHEIRTPLNAVVGFTDLMLSTPLTEEQREYIDHIRESSGIFLDLINDILDFSKIEANRVVLEKIPFNLKAEIEEAVSATGLRAFEKNLEMVLSIHPDVPAHVTGDPIRFKQVLLNIMGNAVKFTSEGHVAVRVFPVSITSENVTIRISVSDTGIGIPEDKLNVIFEPFSQAEESTTREYGGTGLGLAISKKLTEMMGGTIHIESPDMETDGNIGTVFNIDATFDLDLSLQKKDSKDQSDFFPVVLVCAHKYLTGFYYGIFTALDVQVEALEDVSTGLDRQHVVDKISSEKHVLILDDTLPFSEISHALNVILPSISFKGSVVLLLSPYSRIDKELKDSSTPFHTVRKPLKLSALKSILSKNEKSVFEASADGKKQIIPKSPVSYRILLAEDNKTNQKVAKTMLLKMGHSITIAENGREVLEVLEREKNIDLILMDGQMPVMNGFKTTEAIREQENKNPEKQRIPIIALTADAMKGDREKFIKSGMDDYISKPVKYDSLFSIITNLMERKKTGRLVPDDQPDSYDIPEF